MAVSSDDKEFLTSAIRQLENVFARCSKSRSSLEHVTRDLRLLFKAWPVDKSSEASQQPHAPTATVQWLPEELAELSLVEKAISKAERTRSHFSAKLAREEKTGSSTDLKFSLHANKYGEMDERSKTKPQQPHKASATTSSSRSRLSAKLSNTTGIIHPAALARILDTDSKKTSAKVTSKRPSLPVHAKAPFQTKPDVKKPLKKPSLTIHRPVSKTGSKEISQASSISSSTSLKSSKAHLDTIRTIHVKEADCRSRQSADIDTNNVAVTNELNNPSCKPAQNVFTETRRLDVAEPVESVEDKTAVKPFKLATDGANLKMPASYARVASSNFRLRVKLQRQQVKRRVSAEVSTTTGREHFLQAMESHNASRLLPEEATVWRQVTAYTNAYRNLRAMLQNIGRSIPTERSGWEDVVTCQRRLEYVRRQWLDLVDGYQQLQGATTSIAQREPAHIRQLRKLRAGGPSSASFLPPHMQERLPPPPALMRYHDAQSLHRYHDLLHAARLLLLRLHTLDTLHKPLTDMLHQMDPAQREFYHIYRSAYSLLCTETNIFPSLVHDSPEDEDDDDENDF